MLCEGEKMLGEALRSGAKLKTVLVRDGWDSPLVKEAEEQGASLYSAPDALFKLASEVETPQNVIFSCEQPQWTADALDGAGQVLLLDGLQDPGNLGTILRTAEGAGVTGILMTEGCVDLYNPKVIRSTMGSIYRMPFCYVSDFGAAIRELKKEGVKWYAAHLRGSGGHDTMDYTGPSGFLIGNESKGLSDKTADLADAYVRIPMCGQVESLNAAVASAILMYEANRQRRAK